MKELGALCAVVAGILLMRYSSLTSAWDVLMAAGDVCALGVGTWVGYVLHSRLVRGKSWREMGTFLGSPFSYVFAGLMTIYVLYNWSANRPPASAGFEPRAHVVAALAGSAKYR